jgi:hypothetical protein
MAKRSLVAYREILSVVSVKPSETLSVVDFWLSGVIFSWASAAIVSHRRGTDLEKVTYYRRNLCVLRQTC